MKKELIKKMFEEFEKDKFTIEKNLLQVMDTIILATKDNYGTLTMTIKYERKGKGNEEFFKKNSWQNCQEFAT